MFLEKMYFQVIAFVLLWGKFVNHDLQNINSF